MQTYNINPDISSDHSLLLGLSWCLFVSLIQDVFRLFDTTERVMIKIKVMLDIRDHAKAIDDSAAEID